MVHPAQAVLETLQSGTDDEKLKAADKVHTLSTVSGSLTALDECIGPLLKMLSTDGDSATVYKTKMMACRALEALAESRPERKAAIMQQGAAPLLLTIMRLEPAEEAVAAAAKCCWKLCTNAVQFQETFLDAGAIPILVDLLLNKATLQWAIAALHSITAHSERARSAVYESQAIECLTATKMTGHNQTVREWAQDTLNNLQPLKPPSTMDVPRYSAHGPGGAVTDHQGTALYSM